MKKLSPNAKLVVALAHLIEEHDTKDLLGLLSSRNLLKETGLYFDSHIGNLVGTKYHAMRSQEPKHPDYAWKYKNEEEPQKLVLRVSKELEKTYGKAWKQDLKLFQALDSLVTHYYFQKTGEGQYSIHGHYPSMLAYFLDYIVLDKIGGDYSHAHEAWYYKHEMGGTGNKLSTVGTHTSEMLPGVAVKIFANGRVDIKGLTATQYAKIDTTIAFIKDIAKK